jgi:AcrR family transcriptional regulator
MTAVQQKAKKAPTKRARKPEDKVKRGNEILDVAWKMYEKSEGVFPTVSQIAKRAGLAKGTMYLYFSTKEEIFLELFLRQLEEWATSSLPDVKKMRGKKVDARKIARIFTRYPLTNPSFLRLASTIKSVVEANSNDEAVFQSRIRIANELDRLAEELYEMFPAVPKKRMTSVFIKVFALIVGLYQIFTTSEEIQLRLKENNISIFDREFSNVVDDAVTSLLRGSLNI